MILLRQPFSGTQAEQDAVRDALATAGIAKPTWKTLVVAGSASSAASPQTVWQTLSMLESWPGWSPLHRGARWLGEPGWRTGARFAQTLALGFPLGTVVTTETVTRVVPGSEVAWCRDEAGVLSCHLWRLVPVTGGRTRVITVEVLQGLPAGLLAPFVATRWTRLLEDAARELGRTVYHKTET